MKSGPNELDYRCEEQDPSKTLFKLTDELLKSAGLSLFDLGAIIFCSGPGSMLGARTSCMAIRSWKGIGVEAANNVFEYNSLRLGACLVESASGLPESGLIVTDARRSSWNALDFPAYPDSSIQIVGNEQLEKAGSAILSFEEFPTWTKTEASITKISYSPAQTFANEAFLAIIKQVPEAVPLVIRQNEFKKWDAKIHAAPEA